MTPEVSFVVPGQPVSVNRAYRRAANGRMHKADEASSWQGEIEWTAIAARNAVKTVLCEAYRGPVAVRLTCVFGSERPDIDGPVKLVLDALQGVLFANDRQVRELVVQRCVDPKNPRLEVLVRACAEVAA